jgi:pimeloyl-ACP methyl ester carboxylesterase
MNFFAKPQRLVKINRRRRMNIWRSGRGSPAVVLAPGFMALTADWHRVQPTLAQTTRVVSYDHAGQGFSDPGPLPRTPARNAADLKAALLSGGIEPPYVLVGLSMGGFEVRHFAHNHPGEVVGMVLVDPSPDNWAERMMPLVPTYQAQFAKDGAHFSVCARCAERGELQPGTEAYEACVFHPRPDQTEALNTARHDMSLRSSYWRSLNSERLSSFIDKADWPMGALPLIVLSAGARELPPWPLEETEAFRRALAEAHEEMARLSSRGVRRVVPESKHHIPMDRPRAVIDAVLEVIAEVRA